MHNGIWLGIIIIVLFIILTILSFEKANSHVSYGTYEKEVGHCIPIEEDCTKLGEQVIIERCIPNPKTGLGCFENGVQTFRTNIIKQQCTPICIKSYWENISVEEDLKCKPKENGGSYSEIDCIPSGVIGIRTLVYKCVTKDKYGIDLCDDNIIKKVKDEYNVEGLVYNISGHSVGSEAKFEIPCDDYDKPKCGTWHVAKSQSNSNTTNNQLTLNECVINYGEHHYTDISLVIDCMTKTSSYPYNLLEEGYYAKPLTCLKNSTNNIKDRLVTPRDPDDEKIKYCSSIVPPTCNSTKVITTANIQNRSINISNFNPVACNDVYNWKNNPTCVYMCRKIEQDSIGDSYGLLRYIYSKRFIGIIYSDNPTSFCNSSTGTPTTSDELFISTVTRPKPYIGHPQDPFDHNYRDDDLQDTMLTTLNYVDYINSLPNCNELRIKIDASVIFMLAPRSNINSTTNTFQGIIGIRLDNQLDGWLATKNVNGHNIGFWRQGAYQYRENTENLGIMSDKAQQFKIKLKSWSEGEVSGFPESLGKMVVEIKDLSDNEICIANSNTNDIGNPIPCCYCHGDGTSSVGEINYNLNSINAIIYHAVYSSGTEILDPIQDLNGHNCNPKRY